MMSIWLNLPRSLFFYLSFLLLITGCDRMHPKGDLELEKGSSEQSIWPTENTLFYPGDYSESRFGSVVAIDGEVMVVGAPAQNMPSGTPGLVYVFEKQLGNWSLKQKLEAAADDSPVEFGCSVAVSGSKIAVGNCSGMPSIGLWGSIYIFSKDSGGDWIQTQRIHPQGDWGLLFGFGNKIFLDGDKLFSGVSLKADEEAQWDTGVFWYVDVSGTWSAQTPLMTGVMNPYASIVSVDVQGGTMAIGNDNDSTHGSQSGAVHLYTLSGNAWLFQDTVYGENGSEEQRFGTSVSLHGDHLLVGAIQDDTYLGEMAGSVSYFEREDNSWLYKQWIRPLNGFPYDYFGSNISMVGSVAIVGMWSYSTSSSSRPGSAYIFSLVDGQWQEKLEIQPEDGLQEDYFGYAVALDGKVALVGAPYLWNDSPLLIGRVYLFDVSCADENLCDVGYCADGLCCDSECGGNDPYDCLGCSESVGALEDGVCHALSGTECRFENAVGNYQDGVCVEGECEPEYEDDTETDDYVEMYGDDSTDGLCLCINPGLARKGDSLLGTLSSMFF